MARWSVAPYLAVSQFVIQESILITSLSILFEESSLSVKSAFQHSGFRYVQKLYRLIPALHGLTTAYLPLLIQNLFYLTITSVLV